MSKIVDDLKLDIFFTQAQCGHVLRLIDEAKSQNDLDHIGLVIRGTTERIAKMRQTIVQNRISDKDVETGLWGVNYALKETVIPKLNSLKLRRITTSMKEFLNDWLPVLNEAMKTTEQLVKVIKAFK